LDLSIPKNVNEDVQELDGVTLIHILFVAIDGRNFRKQKKSYSSLRLLLKKSKKSSMFGQKDENLRLPFML
jgi:glutamyl-tRNA reductase